MNDRTFNLNTALLYITVLLLFGSESVFGQSKLPNELDVEQLSNVSTPSAKIGPSIALEGAIDPSSYILGPGDRLWFNVWGTLELHQETIVSPDGTIMIPNVGEIKVSGLSLVDADSLVKRLASKCFLKAKLNLTLSAVRNMKVTISGAVVNPGVYELASVDRLSTLIGLAGGLIEPPIESPEVEKGLQDKSSPTNKEKLEKERKVKETLSLPFASKRYITIKSADGVEKNIDYLKFLRIGDVNYNPVLKDGDRVHIAISNVESGVVNIFGSVKAPGEYEYLPGDKLVDIIKIAGGLCDDALAEEITIVRFSDDGRTQVEYVIDISKGDNGNFDISPDDRIFVRKKPDFKRKYKVTVKGEVLYPGVYPIENNVTKLSELIQSCGGFTDRANYRSAKVMRESLKEMEDPEFERLKMIPVADMTPIEYGYFKTRMRIEVPTVVVDFSDLFLKNDLSQDITLVDGDEIIVPTLSPTVNVIGQVNNPGLVHYVSNKNYKYYIEKAGGYSWNAKKSKMRLIKAHTGTWIKPKSNTPIEIGDTIFIPERSEVDWWVVWKDIILVISQVATIIIVINTIK